MSKTVEEHRRKASKPPSFYVIVTSDTLYAALRRGERIEDENGLRIMRLVTAEGYEFKGRSIVPNDPDTIRGEIVKVVEALKPDVIVTTGGTGLGAKDLTIEVVEGLLEKRIPGFGELLRLLSYNEIGSAAMLTRATAGTHRGTVIFSIPGSPHAVELALKKLIIPEAKHIVAHLRGY
ncbi:MAG: MogA/MoaB family molybdenum cofactor biosynthesis protein [Candidatus Nezhaarchaeota archaeon]|nr:MogA/MoaB family molybdenum cofactor biosynthesis protein [Candidatus Nezhaarchaeota archaeon]